MSLNLRIFMTYFLIAAVASILFLNVFMSELKPGIRQSSEHSLIDTSNILAELVASEFMDNPDKLPNFTLAVERFVQREYQEDSLSTNKISTALRIYLTDEKGIIRFDSSGQDLGADYSQWNDVYLTLRGEYGARSTKADADDEFSTVMHVAAPIKSGNKIIGVLAVAKANFSVQPFIDMAYKKIIERGIWLVIASLLVTLVLSFLLTRSIRKLVRYADNISHGKKVNIPTLHESELANLASSIDNMRKELEGKDYVEKYVHALTHELKSPVSAIKGASELLNPLMSAEDQDKFMGNIRFEAHRIDDMINRLLALVTVEKKDALDDIETLDLIGIVEQVIQTKTSQLVKLGIVIDKNMPQEVFVNGDGFLLSQALDNLLQNAIDFSPQNSRIKVNIDVSEFINITIEDQGSGIPDYALAKIFDRFYSLARPITRKKSSGLGLCFVKQIAELHKGTIQLQNHQASGINAYLRLPRSK